MDAHSVITTDTIDKKNLRVDSKQDQKVKFTKLSFVVFTL